MIQIKQIFFNRFWFIVFSSYSPQCTTKDGSGWAIDVTEMIFHEKAPNKHKPIHAHTPTLSLSHTHPPTLTPSLTHTHKLLPALTHTNTNSPKSSYYAKRTNTLYRKVDVLYIHELSFSILLLSCQTHRSHVFISSLSLFLPLDLLFLSSNLSLFSSSIFLSKPCLAQVLRIPWLQPNFTWTFQTVHFHSLHCLFLSLSISKV